MIGIPRYVVDREATLIELESKITAIITKHMHTKSRSCKLCGHDGKEFDTFAKAPKQCCTYIGGGGSGMCLCHCDFGDTQ